MEEYPDNILQAIVEKTRIIKSIYAYYINKI